ncbi:MAG: hypothetical protein V5A68_04745, partial [Candidatus Thermoplasmatota archaeon]
VLLIYSSDLILIVIWFNKVYMLKEDGSTYQSNYGGLKMAQTFYESVLEQIDSISQRMGLEEGIHKKNTST